MKSPRSVPTRSRIVAGARCRMARIQASRSFRVIEANRRSGPISAANGRRVSRNAPRRFLDGRSRRPVVQVAAAHRHGGRCVHSSRPPSSGTSKRRRSRFTRSSSDQSARSRWSLASRECPGRGDFLASALEGRNRLQGATRAPSRWATKASWRGSSAEAPSPHEKHSPTNPDPLLPSRWRIAHASSSVSSIASTRSSSDRPAVGVRGGDGNARVPSRRRVSPWFMACPAPVHVIARFARRGRLCGSLSLPSQGMQPLEPVQARVQPAASVRQKCRVIGGPLQFVAGKMVRRTGPTLWTLGVRVSSRSGGPAGPDNTQTLAGPLP